VHRCSRVDLLCLLSASTQSRNRCRGNQEPQRNVPFGLIGSLEFCHHILKLLVAAGVVGTVPAHKRWRDCRRHGPGRRAGVGLRQSLCRVVGDLGEAPIRLFQGSSRENAAADQFSMIGTLSAWPPESSLPLGLFLIDDLRPGRASFSSGPRRLLLEAWAMFTEIPHALEDDPFSTRHRSLLRARVFFSRSAVWPTSSIRARCSAFLHGAAGRHDSCGKTGPGTRHRPFRTPLNLDHCPSLAIGWPGPLPQPALRREDWCCRSGAAHRPAHSISCTARRATANLGHRLCEVHELDPDVPPQPVTRSD